MRDCACGPKFGAPLKWVRLPQFCFKEDCCFHDFLYELGGSEEDRKLADEQFFGDMLWRINRGKPWWQLPGHYVTAWVYYRAVRFFGKRFFRYRELPKLPADDVAQDVARLLRNAERIHGPTPPTESTHGRD